MENSEFITKLLNIYDEYKNTSEEDMQSKYQAIKSLLSLYESYIPEFFSKSGASENIRKIYEEIDAGAFEGKTINTIDMNLSSHIYKEYFTGMMKFAIDIINTCANELSDDVKTTCEEKLQKAHQADNSFIDSLFGGTNNETKECSVKDAVSNIEFLIEFIPMIKDFQVSIDQIHDSMQNEKNEMTDSCGLVVFNSIAYYCNKSMMNMIQTYDMIENLANSQPALDTLNENNTFQLF